MCTFCSVGREIYENFNAGENFLGAVVHDGSELSAVRFGVGGTKMYSVDVGRHCGWYCSIVFEII